MSTESGRSAPRIRLWSLSEDVLVEDDPDDVHVVVITRWGETKIDDPDGTARKSLRRMSLGPISLGNVVPDSRQGAAEWERIHSILAKLGGSVVHSLGTHRGGTPMLSVVPVARDAVFEVRDVDPTLPVRLSRFAALRSSDGELLVESPLARFQVVLHRRMVSRVVVAMCAPTSIAELARALDLDQSVVADIVAYLVATGIVLLGSWQDREPAREPRFAEDADPALVRWSHHDLLFHARTRMGRHGGLTGVTFPHADTSPPPEVVKERTGPRYPLHRPSPQDLVAGDPPLLAVVENTRLCQEMHGPVSADQVGELLFRAARVRSVSPASAGGEHVYEVSDRPYLSINGLYELELYLCLNDADGLPRGIFHYDPQDHALTLVNDAEEAMAEVLEHAMIGTGAACWPPVMITVTARVARSSWMYGGIAYSLTLTHVGALQQMLCISATAMGLAACVPAIDPGDAIDTALGLEWPAEVGVGEFVFGNRQGGPVRPVIPL